jgi:hypothetical protein
LESNLFVAVASQATAPSQSSPAPDEANWIQLYTSSDDPSAVAAYDRAWFEEFLAGVQLQPEDAVD